MTIKHRLEKLAQAAQTYKRPLTVEETRQRILAFFNDPNKPAEVKQRAIAKIEEWEQARAKRESSCDEHQNETHQTRSCD